MVNDSGSLGFVFSKVKMCDSTRAERTLLSAASRGIARRKRERIYSFPLCLRVKRDILPTLSRSRHLNINAWEDALVEELSVKMKLHVSGSLELFEDDFIHL